VNRERPQGSRTRLAPQMRSEFSTGWRTNRRLGRLRMAVALGVSCAMLLAALICMLGGTT
jgi:hypothetical protein